MIFKNIKNLILILALMLCLPTFAKPNYSYSTNTTKYDYSGTYINEEINVPVTKIGIPQEFFEEQKEETGLEIVWNSWHAKVRNKVLEAVRYLNYSKKHLVCKAYLVDKNKNVSDIIVCVLHEDNMYIENKNVYVKPNIVFYAYKNDENKFYKMQVHQEGLKASSSEFTKILAAAEYTPVGFYAITESNYYVKVARKIEELNGKSVLKFPKKSKRTKVVVTQGTTNIGYLKGDGKYHSRDFNDIER
jgi:hypothetical protein